MELPFSIWVDYHTHGINLYTGDLFEPYPFGQFPDCAAALAACRQLVDEYITDIAQPGVTAAKIIETWADQGVNPKVIHRDGSPAHCPFDAATYAAQRARELAGDLWNTADLKSRRARFEPVESPLSNLEIANRVAALGEPNTYGGLKPTGGLDSILRLHDGSSARFFRPSAQGPVDFTAVVRAGARTPYRAEDRRWDSLINLLARQSPEERALETLREAAKEKAAVIDLSDHALTTLPAELWMFFDHITGLILQGNWLRALPTSILRLTKLESLNVANNCLSELPANLGQLQNLKTLNASGNALTTLPDSVFTLANLANLNLSSNRLGSLSPDLWKLARLGILRLDRNELGALPNSLSHLTRLKKLTLDHNRLRELPLEIGRLKDLLDFEERTPDPKKRHLPSPDELHGLTADVNPLSVKPPSLYGSRLRNHLAGELKARLDSFPWYAIRADELDFGVRVPAPPVLAKPLQYQARAPRALYSVGIRPLPQPVDPTTLDQAIEEMEAKYQTEWTRPTTRKKWKIGLLPGIEHAIVTPAGVLRLLTVLSATRLYQLQAEGPPDVVFSGETDYFFDSLRIGKLRWKDHTLECRIDLGIPDSEPFILSALVKALPALQWSEGDSSWDKIRVSGESPELYVRVYRYEEPGPFDLTIIVRAVDGWSAPEATALALRDVVLGALKATIWKPLEPQPVTLLPPSPAYTFDSDLALSMMKDKLDSAEFWSWQSRGEHLIEGHIPFKLNGHVKWTYKERVRISGTRPHYRIEVGIWPDEPGRTPTCAELHQIVQHTLLPALGARNLAPA